MKLESPRLRLLLVTCGLLLAGFATGTRARDLSETKRKAADFFVAVEPMALVSGAQSETGTGFAMAHNILSEVMAIGPDLGTTQHG